MTLVENHKYNGVGLLPSLGNMASDENVCLGFKIKVMWQKGSYFPKQLKLRYKKRPVLLPSGKTMKLGIKRKQTVVFNTSPSQKLKGRVL